MGVGIGGDYPLSATISSEFASTRIRGRMMTAVFAAQGWGNFSESSQSVFCLFCAHSTCLAAVLVALIVTVAYKDKILSDPSVNNLDHVDYMWRILIGLGCVPGVFALYFRLTIPETPRFTMDIERNIVQATDDINDVLTTGQFSHDPDAVVQRADAPRASWADFKSYFGKWQNGKVLFGTAYSWFALDVSSCSRIAHHHLIACIRQIAFYGLGLNSSIILQAIGFGTPLTTGTRAVYDNLHNIATGNLILSVAGLIPGYWVSFLFIDSWGRKPIQLMGFIILTLLFIIMGS